MTKRLEPIDTSKYKITETGQVLKMTKDEMKDEEKAKEWVRTNSGYSTKEFHGQKAIEAFLAGVEAGKSQAETDLAIVAYMQGAERYKLKWHDLRNNPNDLPEPYTTVLDENSNKVEYIGYGKWQVYSEYYERYSEVDPPIAWCEIPKFEEVKEND